MCKYCNEDIYFDKSWAYIDAGYGDTDYGGKAVNLLTSIICPSCGKLKPSAIKKFGTLEKALSYIVSVNKPVHMDSEEFLEVFRDILKDNDEERFSQILNDTGLILENDTLSCKCGKVLLQDIGSIRTINTLEDSLTQSGTKFCPNCGKHLVPFKEKNRAIEGSAFEIKRIKTWDRN